MFYTIIYFVLTIYMSLELDLTNITNISVDIEDIGNFINPEPHSVPEPEPEPEPLSISTINNDRYLLCIISCEKNRERKKILKDKWINDLIVKNDKIDTLFIYGNSELEEDYAEVEDELHVKCDDSYERLIDKMDQLWNYIHKCRRNYFKIIKCDDDNFINTDKFNMMLDDIKELPIFGKSCIYEKFKNYNSEKLERDKWYGGFKIGWLYIVKLEVIDVFIHNRDTNFKEYIGLHEDKRFYDMIRNNYPFYEDKELENKYVFTPYKRRNRRNRRRPRRAINEKEILNPNATLITNLNIK